jgi:hypothetical protein
MVLRLLTLPFRIVGFLFSLVFTTAIVEGFGLFGYSQWRHGETVDAMTADGLTVPEVVGFVFGHPDVLGVAVVLFFVAFWMALSSDSGGTTHAEGWDGDDGGGFGGFDGGGGGGFGGDGGGGGGDGGE